MDLTQIPLQCEAVIPEPGQPVQEILPRWSYTFVDLPAMVVTPNSEADIVEALKYAREKGLTILTANGKNGTFIPISSTTLYLDMKKFNSIALDEASSTVRIGGGASTGEVIEATTSKGYYTLWPNSNAVGYVGCILGAGSDTMNGLHGYMIDAVESIQLITTEGVKLEVGPSSQGKERELFNAFCGAGFGLGVVTSVVMKMFRISSLNMTDNSTWTRRVVLPAGAIDIAAATFASFRELPPALHLTMVCLRSPPNAPNPGAPLIMITASYFGPAEDGEKATPALFERDLVTRAVSAQTEFVPLAEANTPLKPLSARGGYKGFSNTFLPTIDADAIKAAFEKWVQLGDRYKDAHPTSLIFNKWDTKVIRKHGLSEAGRGKFFEHRDDGMVAFVMRWCTSPQTTEAVNQLGDDFLMTVRRSDTTGPPFRSIANNQRPGMDLEELYSKEKLAEWKTIKSQWDPHGVLWSPY